MPQGQLDVCTLGELEATHSGTLPPSLSLSGEGDGHRRQRGYKEGLETTAQHWAWPGTEKHS